MMGEAIAEVLRIVWSSVPRETEFWSAIAGAVVGGIIAYIVQVRALREGRRHRDDDRRQVQQVLGHSLLFKMRRIHSNLHGIHNHVESCLAHDPSGSDQPWRFFLPLANPPDAVHFSAEEMGMLLALRSDDVFNLVSEMDVVHNSLVEAVMVLNNERRTLAARLQPAAVTGNVVSGELTAEQMLLLAPQMIDVNSLIVQVRARAARDYGESRNALEQLHVVLREKLGLAYKLEFQATGP